MESPRPRDVAVVGMPQGDGQHDDASQHVDRIVVASFAAC
jgi:hypothetical protein